MQANQEGVGDAFLEAVRTVRRLREPGGCPWDREQDHRSLRRYAVEEAYELAAAVDGGDPAAIEDELADLLLQVLLHAVIAEEAGEFTLTDLLRHFTRKLVRRHPHVFAGLELRTAREVERGWEQIKAGGPATGRPSALGRPPFEQPALAAAQEIGERAAAAGFDWESVDGVWKKLSEEAEELRQARDPLAREEEAGDFLFTAVNLCRWYGVDAELALAQANRKFVRRFQAMERLSQGSLTNFDAAELDRLWQQAKSTAAPGPVEAERSDPKASD
ncbi:MAG: nucleoside triphosphate pyrophosphohydrolase [Bacillota bacterium]|nr:nucleoside triphosphate pyrophosphohydrolase [Bacillota bacterium]